MISLDKNTAMSDVKLSLEFKHKDPIELIGFTESLMNLASSYERHVLKISGGQTVDKQSRLYISKIKSGSIVIDLVDLYPVALAFMADTNTLIEFGKHLKKTIDFFLNKTKDKVEIDKHEIKEIAKIIDPIAKDRGGQLNIAAQNVTTGDIYVTFNINSIESNAIQNKVSDQLSLMNVAQQTNFNKVLFYWYQARSDFESKAGFTGIIESITAKPLKVIFADDDFKIEMLGKDNMNPFNFAFTVDVLVETLEGKPFAYKILKIHESYHR